jgi:hypothetical protein
MSRSPRQKEYCITRASRNIQIAEKKNIIRVLAEQGWTKLPARPSLEFGNSVAFLPHRLVRRFLYGTSAGTDSVGAFTS